MSHRILIVDDEINHRRSLSISIRMEGYEALEAADGQYALETLKRERVDVVVCDLMMPRIDGLELARRLRFTHPGTRVILMSAYHLTRAQLERAQVGEVGFLPKPYCFETLREQLESLLARPKARFDELANPARGAARDLGQNREQNVEGRGSAREQNSVIEAVASNA
jgi:two-component system response regulator MprA